MIGTTISHYKVISELGRGGMGVVYKAEDTKLNRVVALKVLSPHMMGSEDDRARFYREARAAAALHHPNIATVFEIDEHDDAPFIAMEFIDGPSLDEYIARGPLPLDEVIDIAAQVAGALGVAHAKGIVHRDVKSANIKLTNDGVAKVLDFGLAKTSASTKLTQMGSTVGTVAYMSPEQASGHEVDQRSDIWSLGAVIYEMIAGKMPFPGAYEQAVVYSILNTDPPSLTTIRTGVPMALERIVAKCLSKDVDRRYQSTVEIPVDLRAVDLKNEVTTSGLSAVLNTPLVVDPAAPVEPDTAGAESKAAHSCAPRSRVDQILLGCRRPSIRCGSHGANSVYDAWEFWCRRRAVAGDKASVSDPSRLGAAIPRCKRPAWHGAPGVCAFPRRTAARVPDHPEWRFAARDPVPRRRRSHCAGRYRGRVSSVLFARRQLDRIPG